MASNDVDIEDLSIDLTGTALNISLSGGTKRKFTNDESGEDDLCKELSSLNFGGKKKRKKKPSWTVWYDTSDPQHALFGDNPRTRVLVISKNPSHEIELIKTENGFKNIKWFGAVKQRSWEIFLKFHQITNVIIDWSRRDKNIKILSELLKANMIAKIQNPKWKSSSSSSSSQPQKMYELSYFKILINKF